MGMDGCLCVVASRGCRHRSIEYLCPELLIDLKFSWPIGGSCDGQISTAPENL